MRIRSNQPSGAFWNLDTAWAPSSAASTCTPVMPSSSMAISRLSSLSSTSSTRLPLKSSSVPWLSWPSPALRLVREERVASRRLGNRGQGTKALTPARVARYSIWAQSSSEASRMGKPGPASCRAWEARSRGDMSSSSWPSSRAQGMWSSNWASVRRVTAWMPVDRQIGVRPARVRQSEICRTWPLRRSATSTVRPAGRSGSLSPWGETGRGRLTVKQLPFPS